MYLLPIFLCFLSFFISITVGKHLGFKGSVSINILSLLLSLLFAYLISYEVCILDINCYINLFPFITVSNLNLYWSFVFDTITCIMLIVILSISFIANIYSVEYMLYDPHKIRFFSYLSLFTWTMIMLVTANSILQLFFGWECVGITSYLLINFWYTRIQANKSAILAVMANKLGDSLLLISCLFMLHIYNSMYFNTIFLCEQYAYINTYDITECSNMWLLNDNKIHYLIISGSATGLNSIISYNSFIFISTFMCFFIVLASVCKSAQAGFHFWLAEAMEGPTPVSSLLHAATMVTAGVFLTVRCSYLFHSCYSVTVYIIFVGSLTAFFASLVGVTQNDIKKIVAYSTCSQLGYMFLSNGICSYNITMFHLFNHAFFKALLFLTSGYIIHILSNEQDIRKIGSMLKILPLPYICLCIGSVSLMGIPFFSGFFSKDFIIESFYGIYTVTGLQGNDYTLIYFAQLLLSTSVLLTITYSIKLVMFVFLNRYRGYYSYIINIHFSGYLLVIPIILLSCASIISGYVLSDAMIGSGTLFWKNSIDFSFYKYGNVLNNTMFLFNNNIGTFFVLLPYQYNKFTFYYTLINTIYYIVFIHTVYTYNLYTMCKNILCNRYYGTFYTHLNRKILFYNRLITNGIVCFFMKESYNSTYKFIDKQFFELFGPFGIVICIKNIFKYIQFLNTGLLYHYLGLVLLSLIIIMQFGFCY